MSEMMLAVRPDGSAYLMHHGVKGMKWGVRKDRYLQKKTARASMYEAKKNRAILKSGADSYRARKFGKKQAKQEFFANVERERQNPGSTKLNSTELRYARIGQIGQAIYSGRQAMSLVGFAGMNVSAVAGYAAFNVANATLASVAAPVVAAGVSAVGAVMLGRHAIRSTKRAIETSRAIRMKDAAEREQAKKQVQRRQLADPALNTAKDSMRRVSGGKDPRVEYDEYGRVKSMRVRV